MVDINDYDTLIDTQAEFANKSKEYLVRVRATWEKHPDPRSEVIKKANDLKSKLISYLVNFKGIYFSLVESKEELVNKDLSGIVFKLTGVLNTWIEIDYKAEELCTEKYKDFKDIIHPIKEVLEDMLSVLYNSITVAKKLNLKKPIERSEIAVDSLNRSRMALQKISDGNRTR